MAKAPTTSNLKFLLVAFTTSREVNGEKKRVRFSAKSTVDLTADELETLDKLTVSTGKLHYREPINERAQADEPEVVATPDFAGQDVPMGSKTVPQLRAYLDHHKVEVAADADKKTLLAAAEKHEADPDGGL